MKTHNMSGLYVVELPYIRDDHQMMRKTQLWRELDDFKLCGVYHTSGVPVTFREVTYEESKYSTDGSDVFDSYGDICSRICQATKEGLLSKNGIVFVGGDCRHTIGLLGAIQQVYGLDVKIGFIWLDAHGDFNTPETTLTGVLGGMPLAVCAGYCCETWRKEGGLIEPIPCDHILLADGRNLDPLEENAIKNSGMTYIPTDKFKNPTFWENAIQEFSRHVDVICLHIDLDILDEVYVPNHSTVEGNGPSVKTVMDNIAVIMKTEKVVCYTVTSVYHPNGKPGQDTSTLNAIRLLASGLRSWKNIPLL